MALSQNTSGYNNTAFGASTLLSGNGHDNTAIGDSALRDNQGGVQNTAIGNNALLNNNDGYGNIAVGYSAAFGSNDGDYNTAMGYAALLSNQGNHNLSIGAYSSIVVSSGNNNVALGSYALNKNQTGSNNVVIGDNAGKGINGKSHSNNILIGYKAADNISTGSSNIIIGSDIDIPDAVTDDQLVIGNLIYGTGLEGTGTTVSTGKIGIGVASPQQKLSVAGVIESTTGGVKFPDGTVQTTASGGSGIPYDSGWFAVSTGSVNSFSHGLGVVPSRFQVTFSTSSSGNPSYSIGEYAAYSYTGYALKLTHMLVSVKAGDGKVALYFNGSGYAEATTGYYRVQVWK